MNSLLSLHDLVIIGVQLLGFIVMIVTVKVDVRWIKQWCRDHREEDQREFQEVKSDIRDLRLQLRRP